MISLLSSEIANMITTITTRKPLFQETSPSSFSKIDEKKRMAKAKHQKEDLLVKEEGQVENANVATAAFFSNIKHTYPTASRGDEDIICISTIEDFTVSRLMNDYDDCQHEMKAAAKPSVPPTAEKREFLLDNMDAFYLMLDSYLDEDASDSSDEDDDE